MYSSKSEIRIVDWPHYHGIGKDRYEHRHVFDVRNEDHHKDKHGEETQEKEILLGS